MNEYTVENNGIGIKARRAIAYIVLITITFFCLIWFFILLINATRSNAELTAGFTPIPSTHAMENWNSLVTGTLPMWTGLRNSFIVAALSALLSIYFYFNGYDDSDTGNSTWFC